MTEYKWRQERKVIEIWSDGSCLSNPGGKCGWAAVFQYKGVRKVLFGSFHSGSNNQAELIAAIEGLTHLRESCNVVLHSDSKYVINGANLWLDGWVAKGWKTSGKTAVKNQHLWLQLIDQIKRHEIKWTWVRGHSGNKLNMIADHYATKAATEQLQHTCLDITGKSFSYLKEN